MTTGEHKLNTEETREYLDMSRETNKHNIRIQAINLAMNHRVWPDSILRTDKDAEELVNGVLETAARFEEWITR
jgi:hypothetical protein